MGRIYLILMFLCFVMTTNACNRNENNINNENGHVLLGEIIREEDNIQILGIESTEKDLVIAYYNEVINQIGEEVYE